MIGYIVSAALLFGGFLVATIMHAWLELASDEIRGWLEILPGAILRAAAMRLPADQRLTVYRDEWLPDLLYIMRAAGGRPISRLLLGSRYSLGHLRTARRQARELRRAQRRELVAAEESAVLIGDPRNLILLPYDRASIKHYRITLRDRTGVRQPGFDPKTHPDYKYWPAVVHRPDGAD